MNGESRYSIWRGDNSIDKWYHAATNSISNQSGTYNVNDMGEMLYFDSSKSREAKYPTEPVNDWFYEATHHGNDDVKHKGESSSPRAIPTKKSNFRQSSSVTSSSAALWTNHCQTSQSLPSTLLQHRTSIICSPTLMSIMAFVMGAVAQTMSASRSIILVSIVILFTKGKFLTFEKVQEHHISVPTSIEECAGESSPGDDMPLTPTGERDNMVFESFPRLKPQVVRRASMMSVVGKESDAAAKLTRVSAFSQRPYSSAVRKEERQASTDFFTIAAAHKAENPYHFPTVVGDSGYVDVREGSEEFPEPWEHLGREEETTYNPSVKERLRCYKEETEGGFANKLAGATRAYLRKRMIARLKLRNKLGADKSAPNGVQVLVDLRGDGDVGEQSGKG
jgi:hypothetical protein